MLVFICAYNICMITTPQNIEKWITVHWITAILAGFYFSIFLGITIYGGFHKWCCPKMDGLKWKTVDNPSINGCPYFKNPPICTYINPLAFAVEISEDYVGKKSRLARRVALGQAILRVVQRTLKAEYKLWCEAGFLKGWMEKNGAHLSGDGRGCDLKSFYLSWGFQRTHMGQVEKDDDF